MNIRANLNPWVALQGLTKNPIDNVIEEGRRECTALSDASAFLKDSEITKLTLTFASMSPTNLAGILSATIIRQRDFLSTELSAATNSTRHMTVVC